MHTFRYRLNRPIDDASVSALECVLASLLAGSGAKATVNQESQFLSMRVSWDSAALPIRDLRERFLTDAHWDALQCAFDFTQELSPDGLSPEEIAYLRESSERVVAAIFCDISTARFRFSAVVGAAGNWRVASW